MHKKTITVMILIIILMLTLILGASLKDKNDSKLNIVTSFYPTYIIASNLVEGIPNIEVTNIVTSTTGCIHDYTLTPSDMIKIEKADIFIINGAGMEGFIDAVTSSYPHLPIINASNNISLLNSGHKHEDNHDEEYNSHAWMDPSRYIKQIENVSTSLADLDPNNKDKYTENANKYISKINTLMMTMNEELKDIKDKKIVIFHDAFQYLADYLHLDVVHAVDMDHDEAMSANEVEEIIEEIKANDVKILLVEKQFTNKIVDTIKKEVDVEVYSLDTGVTGEYSLNAYLEAMNANIQLLKEVLS